MMHLKIELEKYSLQQIVEIMLKLKSMGVQNVNIKEFSVEKLYKVDKYLEILREIYEVGQYDEEINKIEW